MTKISISKICIVATFAMTIFLFLMVQDSVSVKAAEGGVSVVVEPVNRYVSTQNQEVLVNVRVLNSSSIDYSNFRVSTQIPGQMSYVYGSASDGGGIRNDSVEWTIDLIRAGESVLRSYKVKFTPTNQESRDYYVSLSGNDSNDGTLDRPFRTLEKARDAIRMMKNQGSLTQPININIRGGVYELSLPFVLTNLDSGTYEYPVTYQSFLGERATLTGASKITGAWSNYSGNSNIKTIQLDPTWKFNSVYVDGDRAIRARAPNIGHSDVMDDYYLIKSVNPVYPEVDDRFEKCTSFQYNNNDISPDWRNLSNVEVVSFRKWEQSRIRISQVDSSNSTVTFSGRLKYSSEPTNDRCYDWVGSSRARYYVENALELLDSPGEWYLSPEGMFYYWPKDGKDIDQIDISAPKIKTNLLYIGNAPAGATSMVPPASNIAIRNIAIQGNDWRYDNESASGSEGTGYKGSQAASGGISSYAAIIIRNAINITLEGNSILNTGYYGVRADGSENLVIRGNEFINLGAGAVWVHSRISVYHLNSTRTTVENNIIQGFGQLYHEGVGVFVSSLRDSVLNVVQDNTIFDGGYSGVSLGWSWNSIDINAGYNRIVNNKIYQVMKRLDDGGGIYILGNHLGSVISGNNIFDIGSETAYPLAGPSNSTNYYSTVRAIGIYLDKGGSGFSVFNNFIKDADTALLNNYDSDNGLNAPTNAIYNNVFAAKAYNCCVLSVMESLSLRANVILFQDYLASYGQCLHWDRRGTKNQLQIDNNLIVSMDDSPIKISSEVLRRVQSLGEWRNSNLDVNSIVTTFFPELDIENLSLRTSPVLDSLGIKPFNNAEAGADI